MLPFKSDNGNAFKNVLIIITDQQRHDAVGYTSPFVITPNLDRLASRSTIFTKAFVQSPQCQPSRASILTGRYPTAHKVWWNETKLDKSEITIGNLFRNAGYRTGYFGKMHVENDLSHSELARHFGWDDTFLMEDWQHLIAKDSYDRKNVTIRKEFYGPMRNKTWTGIGIQNRSLHHEDVITDKALTFIKNAMCPFLAMVSYHGPHPPYVAPVEFSSLYNQKDMKVPEINKPNLMQHTMSEDEWQTLKVQYYGSVTWIDDNIGRLLHSIDDNTIVVFLSDHGDMLGDHGEFSKGIYAYDGNTRIPLLISIPGILPSIHDGLVQAIDLLPTLLEVCKIPWHGGIQGRSLVSAITSNNIINFEIISMLCHSSRLRMIRTNSFKYWIFGDEEFLFDLISDPGENHNLARSNNELLNHARFKLMKKLIECEDPLPYPRPIH